MIFLCYDYRIKQQTYKEIEMDIKQTPTMKIALCDQSDNDLKPEGLFHVVVDDFFLVVLKFRAVFHTEYNPSEYDEDGYTCYEGRNWVEVEEVGDLEVVALYNNEHSDELPLECYIPTEEDKGLIESIIIDEIAGAPSTVRYTENYYNLENCLTFEHLADIISTRKTQTT